MVARWVPGLSVGYGTRVARRRGRKAAWARERRHHAWVVDSSYTPDRLAGRVRHRAVPGRMPLRGRADPPDAPVMPAAPAPAGRLTSRSQEVLPCPRTTTRRSSAPMLRPSSTRSRWIEPTTWSRPTTSTMRPCPGRRQG